MERVRKMERNDKEAPRERTDTERHKRERGRTEQCADDRGVPWRDGNVRHGPAQMIGKCRGAISTPEMTSCRKSPEMNGI